MNKLKPVVINNQYKEAAKEILNEAIDTEPDTAIVLMFWADRGQFKIKCSMVPDRLMLIGVLEEAKQHVIEKGKT